MTTAVLTLETLHQLSPDLAEDFSQQIEEAVRDCRQRPSLTEKREVTIRLTIKPHPQDPDDVLIEPVTTRKTPARKLETVRARQTRTNQLHFDFFENEDDLS